MKLFQDHEGERISIQFADKELRITGFVGGVENNCVKVSAGPNEVGNIRYVPWPNPSVAYIEFSQP